MLDVAIASAAVVLLVIAVTVVVTVRRRLQRGERHRKTMVIQAALPFVPMTPPAIAPVPPAATQPVAIPPAPAPAFVPTPFVPAPLDDDGPTAVDPRYAAVMDVEGPTQRGAGVPPARPEKHRLRDAKVRAAIRANTLHATFKPRR